ncbi:DUF6941 family protein [Curtobacterium sp. NPDC090217]|uniref:DUF6941 family protein n=1 Tax=Curtobacterium sp. NPDC090217 TaxID=3363970 RepID=UPI0037F758AC
MTSEPSDVDVRVQIMTLCDVANERDRLISVLSGGVTRIQRPSFPAPLKADLAILLDLPAHASVFDISMRLELKNVRTGKEIAPSLHMQAEDDGELDNVDETTTRITFPALVGMQEMVIPESGTFSIELLLGERVLSKIELDAVVKEQI